MTGEKRTTVDDLLRPYQNVVDQINRDYAGLGPKIYIRPGKEEEVYNKVKDIPLSEFEKIMRKEYLDALKYANPPKDAEESNILLPFENNRSGKRSPAGGNADRTNQKSSDGKINPVVPIPNAESKIIEVTPLQ